MKQPQNYQIYHCSLWCNVFYNNNSNMTCHHTFYKASQLPTCNHNRMLDSILTYFSNPSKSHCFYRLALQERPHWLLARPLPLLVRLLSLLVYLHAFHLDFACDLFPIFYLCRNFHRHLDHNQLTHYYHLHRHHCSHFSFYSYLFRFHLLFCCSCCCLISFLRQVFPFLFGAFKKINVTLFFPLLLNSIFGWLDLFFFQELVFIDLEKNKIS